MTRHDLVEVRLPARSAFVALPTRARPGTFWQLEDGQVVRVGERGEVEQLVRGGAPWNRSIAADPCAGRGA